MKHRVRELLIIVALVIQASLAYPCSMFKVVVDGKTLIGNNEDYWSPETWIWVSNPEADKFGAVYFGFDNFFPQGGMNDHGLVFDGFSTPQKRDLHAPSGTRYIAAGSFVERVMTTCSTIDQVKGLLKLYSVEEMSVAQLMFVDKSGNSIILEGGNVVVESGKNYQISTNFYQSSIDKNTPITCERYLAMRRMIESKAQPDIAYCKDILKEVHQEGNWGGTQYSNIYDPAKGEIHLFLFHNYDESVRLSVKELLQQKNYRKQLRSLFSHTKEYDAYRKGYTDAQSLTANIGGMENSELVNASIKNLRSNHQTYLWIDQLITSAQEQRSNSNDRNAVDILRFACEIAPGNWKAAHALAATHLANKNINEALREVDRALTIKPNEPVLLKLRGSILSAKK